MPYRDRAALDGFIAELRRVWTLAGPPSYEDFKKLSTRVKGPPEADGLWLSRSTTQDILAGHRQQLPKWRWVARFITVLRVAAKEAGVDPECIGTLAEWKHTHEAAWAAATATQAMECAAGREALTSESTGCSQARALAPRQKTNLLLKDKDAQRDPELAALLQAVGQDWWLGCGDLVPAWLRAYLSLEPAACLIRAYETTLVPGFLQTEEYATAAITLCWPQLDRSSIAQLVELRMRRQQLLNRQGWPKLWAIMEETAVRHQLRDSETMRTQIRHLIEVSDQPNITIQIIPVRSKMNAVADGPITFLRFPRSNLPDVVYLEQLTSALYLTRRDDVSHYMGVLGALGVVALEPDATRDFLHQILMGL